MLSRQISCKFHRFVFLKLVQLLDKRSSDRARAISKGPFKKLTADILQNVAGIKTQKDNSVVVQWVAHGCRRTTISQQLEHSFVCGVVVGHNVHYDKSAQLH